MLAVTRNCSEEYSEYEKHEQQACIANVNILAIVRPTIINSLFPVLVREKYHAGGRPGYYQLFY